MPHKITNTPQYYLLGSKLLTHITFWACYYISFSFIWAGSYGLQASFFLEFILLPTRILAVYSAIYWLLPQYLLKQHYLKFITLLIGLLLVCAVLQRLVIYFFYEEIIIQSSQGLWELQAILKASLLINTTVILAISIKLVGIVEAYKSNNSEQDSISIKSNRKTHIVKFDDILFIEGLGNYVSYHLKDGQKLHHYKSIKKTLEELPNYFVKVHKSYIANIHHIKSFNQESIEIMSSSLPRSKSVTNEELMP